MNHFNIVVSKPFEYEKLINEYMYVQLLLND
jgi:hypothetical protein